MHSVKPFSKKVCLRAIADNKIDALVYDETVLKYIVKTDFPGRLYVLAGTFNHY